MFSPEYRKSYESFGKSMPANAPNSRIDELTIRIHPNNGESIFCNFFEFIKGIKKLKSNYFPEKTTKNNVKSDE